MVIVFLIVRNHFPDCIGIFYTFQHKMQALFQSIKIISKSIFSTISPLSSPTKISILSTQQFPISTPIIQIISQLILFISFSIISTLSSPYQEQFPKSIKISILSLSSPTKISILSNNKFPLYSILSNNFHPNPPLINKKFLLHQSNHKIEVSESHYPTSKIIKPSISFQSTP